MNTTRFSFFGLRRKKGSARRGAGFAKDPAGQWVMLVALCAILALAGVGFSAFLFFSLGFAAGDVGATALEKKGLTAAGVERLSREYDARAARFDEVVTHPPSFVDPSR